MLRNKMDADDVTQEVMIRIWQHIGKFKITAAKTWIMKTTHNLCIDYLRRRQTSDQREFEIDDNIRELCSDNDNNNDPFITAHLKMMTNRLKEAIKLLPDNLRSVLVLYELQGLKYKEISEALDIPLNSVKVNLLRGRRKLQELLKNYEPEEVI